MTASSCTSLEASWQLSQTNSRNGIIRGFKLFYGQKGSETQPKLVHISNASILAATITELLTFTEYEFQLLAYTSVGDGPNSSVHFLKALQDGK